MAQKDKVKELVGRGLHSYHTKSLQQIDRIEKKNKEQNHKISILSNELDNDYLTKTEEGSVVSLEHSKEGMIYLDELQGNTLVNYCTDGSKELTLNGDIDLEGTFVTTTEGVDGGKIDIMCEGNTLVNLADIQSDFHHTNVTSWYKDSTLCETSKLKLNTPYTFIIDKEYLSNHNTNYKQFQLGISNSLNTTTDHPIFEVIKGDINFNNNNKEIKKFVVNFTDFKNSTYLSVRPCRRNTSPVEGESANYRIKVIVLEGDFMGRETPPYFIGMKSVGQDDTNGHKIEILSGTISDLTLETEQGDINISNGENIDNETRIRAKNFTEVKPNTTYELERSIISGNMGIRFYDTNKKYILNSSVYTALGTLSFTTPNNCKYIKFIDESNDLNSIHKLLSVTIFLNKKEILMNEPLRATENYKDKFIKMNGKWYIERNCDTLVLDGTNPYGYSFQNNTQSIKAFVLNGFTQRKRSEPFVIENYPCINSSVWSARTSIGLYNGTGDQCGLAINESELATLDDAGVKEYLSRKPIRLVYAKDVPTYELVITEPTLNTYTDVTHISNNSIIPCNMKIQNTGYNAIIKPSTLYTIALDTNKSGTIGMNLGGVKGTTTNNILTLTTPATLTDDSLRIYGKGIKGSKVRLLEGDKTNWLPSHFEGMKSCFEDKVQEDGSYVIEIVSNNENLFDINKRINKSSKYWWVIPKLKANKMSFKFDTSIPYIEFYESNIDNIYNIYTNWTVNSTFKNVSQGTTVAYKTDKPYVIIAFDLATAPSEEVMKSLQVVDGDKIPTDYTPQITNKIQFSSIEPLRGVGNIKDKFIFKDGKLMIERNCKQITLDGSENWRLFNSSTVKTKAFYLTKYEFCELVKNNSTHICNIYPKETLGNIWGGEFRGSSVSSVGEFLIRVNNNELETQDVDGFKNILKEVNVSVTLILAEPIYEEVPFELQKIILEGYENGTLFFDTNIPPTLTVTYAGETPIVKATKLNKTEVLNNTTDINDNIIPYLMDMDYRVVCLELATETQGISMARLFGGTFEMLQRDILSKRYSVDEYRHRLDAYLGANKITHEEYTKLGDMLND